MLGFKQDAAETTTVLLVGSAEGEVKQYEIIPRNCDDVTHWPRLKNQKLKKRAHTFHGHSSRVTCLTGDHAKVISACEDGCVRFYSSRDGKECAYVMDGLEGISSMAMTESMLVTDGLEGNFVCVHDFAAVQDTMEIEFE